MIPVCKPVKQATRPKMDEHLMLATRKTMKSKPKQKELLFFDSFDSCVRKDWSLCRFGYHLSSPPLVADGILELPALQRYTSFFVFLYVEFPFIFEKCKC